MTQLENFRVKVFRTVAESLSFRKAAEQLFLTQPAITLQIKALEDELGVRLFDRTNRVSLTPQGSILLRYAQKMAALASETEQALAAAQGRLEGEFALGVSSTISQHVLPRLIGAFVNENPRVQLTFHSGNTEEIVKLLLDDRVPIGLIEGPPRHSKVHTEHFMEDELVNRKPSMKRNFRLARHATIAGKLSGLIGLKVKYENPSRLHSHRHRCRSFLSSSDGPPTRFGWGPRPRPDHACNTDRRS